jgi:hypothetical protein
MFDKERMKLPTCIVLCGMFCSRTHADEAITNFVGRWVIDRTAFEERDTSSHGVREFKELSDSVAITITSNALQIVTHFENLDVHGTNTLSLATAQANPPSAVFEVCLADGLVWSNKVVLTLEGKLQFAESNTRNPLSQFVWKREGTVEQIGAP